jgi:hypothetical protein
MPPDEAHLLRLLGMVNRLVFFFILTLQNQALGFT